VKLHPPTHPAGLSDLAMAYDSDTRQLVLFGGSTDYGTNYYNTTWLWNGKTWQKAHPRTRPAARDSASMAFDPKSHQLVLFGGEDPNSYFNDTWTWTGSNWDQLKPRRSPPPSTNSALAYDPVDRGLILLGGLASGGTGYMALGTWLWTGSNWVHLSPPSWPPGRGDASLAWDDATKVLVLFGGLDANGHVFSDTWIWQGQTWQLLRVVQSPEHRAAGETFAFDPTDGAIILFGGFHGSGLAQYGDTWSLKLRR